MPGLVGLLWEQYDVETKRLIGNFPQALSHVALISTAYQLASQTRHTRHVPARPASHDVYV